MKNTDFKHKSKVIYKFHLEQMEDIKEFLKNPASFRKAIIAIYFLYLITQVAAYFLARKVDWLYSDKFIQLYYQFLSWCANKDFTPRPYTWEPIVFYFILFTLIFSSIYIITFVPFRFFYIVGMRHFRIAFPKFLKSRLPNAKEKQVSHDKSDVRPGKKQDSGKLEMPKIRTWGDLSVSVIDPITIEFSSKSSGKKNVYDYKQLGFLNTKDKGGKWKKSWEFLLAYCLDYDPRLKLRISNKPDDLKNYRREINNAFRDWFGLAAPPFRKEQQTLIEIKDKTDEDDFENRHSVSFNDSLKYNLEDCDNLDDSSSDSFY